MRECFSGDRPPSGGFVFFRNGINIKTVVFVDGYNLYYGLLRKSKLKWLDLVRLFSDFVLDKSSELIEVRYYTAPVLGRMSDDPESPKRQRQYIQALKLSHPHLLKIIEGKIVASKPYQRLVNAISIAPDLEVVQVFNFTEKKTDVNLASDLIRGAWKGWYEQAVICSNDSDLEGALFAVKEDHPQLKIGVVAPILSGSHRHISGDLQRHADWKKILSVSHIAQAQLPIRIPNSRIQKPTSW